MEEEPKCLLCDNEAEFDVPNDLCEKHWEDWFNCIIEVPSKHRKAEVLQNPTTDSKRKL